MAGTPGQRGAKRHSIDETSFRGQGSGRRSRSTSRDRDYRGRNHFPERAPERNRDARTGRDITSISIDDPPTLGDTGRPAQSNERFAAPTGRKPYFERTVKTTQQPPPRRMSDGHPSRVSQIDLPPAAPPTSNLNANRRVSNDGDTPMANGRSQPGSPVVGTPCD